MKKSRLTKAAAESAAAATEAGRNIWDDAVERAAAILADAQRKAAPLARKAGKRTADFASKRLDTWEPHIRGALDRVPPAVDAAHEKVTSELLPNLQQALHKAAGHKPAPVKKQKRKGGKFKKFAKFVFISSLVAGAVAAVRPQPPQNPSQEPPENSARGTAREYRGRQRDPDRDRRR